MQERWYQRWYSGRTLLIAVVLTAIIAGSVGFLAGGRLGTASAPPPLPAMAQQLNGAATPTPGTSTSSTPTATPVTPARAITCTYTTQDPNGDDGYHATAVSHHDGKQASFTVKLNAHADNTAVHGYPSDQCFLYSGMPAQLISTFQNAPPAQSKGLDFEYAYDIWLTTKAKATKSEPDWSNDYELMIWTYTVKQQPAGSITHTLADGSKVWTDSGMASVILPQKKMTSGRVDIADIVRQLKDQGVIPRSDSGILDVEYGIEAPYGGDQPFTVSALSVST